MPHASELGSTPADQSIPLLERIQQGSEVYIYQIRNDLRDRCGRIPYPIWREQFPELQMPLTETITSELLPTGDYIESDGEKYVVGHDVVQSFLARNGTILEKLVHYVSDGLDTKTGAPDKVLGEASLERYKESYPLAVQKLDILSDRARSRNYR